MAQLQARQEETWQVQESSMVQDGCQECIRAKSGPQVLIRCLLQSNFQGAQLKENLTA